MNRSHIRRLLGLTAAASLTLAALGAGPVMAATPDWNVSFRSLPAAVKAGNDAGWEVKVSNDGPSQINNLKATIRVEGAGAPVWWSTMPISTGGEAACSDTGASLVCDLGTLVDDAFGTITVAFKAPASAGNQFTIFVDLVAGTGDTDSDGPGKSRGDADTFEWTSAVVTNSNYDGGFVVGDTTYNTTGDLRRQNKQNSEVVVSEVHLPVTIQDGTTVQPSCDTNLIPECANFIGESTVIDVPEHNGLIKVTMFIWGGAVPGGVSEDDIVVIHDPDSGPTYAIDDECTPSTGTPTNAECLTVTKIGSTWKIVVWLNDNGTLRGGF